MSHQVQSNNAVNIVKRALGAVAKHYAKLKISTVSVMLDTIMLSRRVRVRLNVIISYIFYNLTIILNLMAKILKISSSITFKLPPSS